MEKIKVIVKRPDEEYGHEEEIYNSLESLQSIVEGYIEVISLKTFVIICNEEGKLKGLNVNFELGCDVVVGTVIICGIKGDKTADVPFTFEEWKEAFEGLKSLQGKPM